MAVENGHTNNGFIGDEIARDADKEKDTCDDQDEDGDDRVNWSKPIEFLMSCISMNVGLGNIWRFPFVAYENGGGAFLVPYILVLIFLGRPMYYLEACLGQFMSRGNVKIFESMALGLKGIGYGQLLATVSVATYYCSLMAITLLYFVNSFTWNLPWASCDPAWYEISWIKESNVTCVPSKLTSENLNFTGNQLSSAELYFRVEILKELQDITDGIGAPEWRLTICLFVSWMITFAICAKGVLSSGKAAYFLALFPYLILISLLIRAVTLDGASTGIYYFIKPKWEMLLNAKVWYAAVTQCFFSLNIGFGSISMYASYNNFKHNVYRDAMVVTTLDTCTSLLAGTIIFGILGNLAVKMQLDVPDVIKSGGTGLAFISYPEAIARFDFVPWLFAILFFLMLFVLGVGSLVSLQSCAFTVIMDAFPKLKMWQVSLGTALGGFIISLVYITPGGQWIFTMIDFFGGTLIYYVLNICEVILIIYWYGLENISLDIAFMTGRKPGIYWRLCWAVVIPIIFSIVFIYFIITFEPLTYESKPYPLNIISWGWILFAAGVIQPIIWLIYEYFKYMRKTKITDSNLKDALFGHSNWVPKRNRIYLKWKEFKSIKLMERSLKSRSKIVDKLCILIGR
ncbi:sodium-dependent nutrient amino acid transporter 1-like [Rhynchophorus ferrugineus]|uniref:Transporter n=1 Tax=Rhynchophorus ferrugineus TaxID=354439 RepID=A0A834ICV6_RHYFE|nr:hypothetical protein GWI33_008508 [Rhynchophorus ferrugineus]